MGKGSYATKVTKSAPTMLLHLNQQPQHLLHKSTGVAEHRIAKSPTCIIVHDGLFSIRHNVVCSYFYFIYPFIVFSLFLNSITCELLIGINGILLWYSL